MLPSGATRPPRPRAVAYGSLLPVRSDSVHTVHTVNTDATPQPQSASTLHSSPMRRSQSDPNGLRTSTKRKASQQLPVESPTKVTKVEPADGTMAAGLETSGNTPTTPTTLSHGPPDTTFNAVLQGWSTHASPSVDSKFDSLSRSIGLSGPIAALNLSSSISSSVSTPRSIQPLPKGPWTIGSGNGTVNLVNQEPENPFLARSGSSYLSDASSAKDTKTKPRRRRPAPKGTPQLAMSADPSRPIRIIRPPNAWIIYRSEKFAEFKDDPALSEKPQAEISKLIGALWKSESAAVRNRYEALAAAKKAEHRAAHPDYRYSPQKKKGKAALSKSQSQITRSIPVADSWTTSTSSQAFTVEDADLPTTLSDLDDAAEWAVADDKSTVASGASIPAPRDYSLILDWLSPELARFPGSSSNGLSPESPLGSAAPIARFMPSTPLSPSKSGVSSGASEALSVSAGLSDREIQDMYSSLWSAMSSAQQDEQQQQQHVSDLGQAEMTLPTIDSSLFDFMPTASNDDVTADTTIEAAWATLLDDQWLCASDPGTTGVADTASPFLSAPKFEYGSADTASRASSPWDPSERSFSTASSWPGLTTSMNDTVAITHNTISNTNCSRPSQSDTLSLADSTDPVNVLGFDWAENEPSNEEVVITNTKTSITTTYLWS